jgi:hypothetical protein
MPTAIEDSIYDFLKAAIDAVNTAEADFEEDDVHSPLFEAQLLDSPFAELEEKASNTHGIIVDDGESDFAPNPGATEVKEFDGHVTLIVFRSIDGSDRTERKAARSGAISLAMAVAKLFFDAEGCTMNGRVQDARVADSKGQPRVIRGWVNWKSNPYSIMNVPLLINDTGK